MTKRPLNPRFNQAVIEERKVTTMRDKPWPIGVPIMLYNWTAKPYRSPQIDVAPVMVNRIATVNIHRSFDGSMYFSDLGFLDRPLWQTEGFDSREELDEWFRILMKPGEHITKPLMHFSLINP